MEKFNLSGRFQLKKEPLIVNQKLKTDVNKGVCYPRLRDFLKCTQVVSFSSWGQETDCESNIFWTRIDFMTEKDAHFMHLAFWI